MIEQLTIDWPAREKWNTAYLKKVAGENIIPLYDSQRATERKHQHASATQMKLKDYLDLLEQGEKACVCFFTIF